MQKYLSFPILTIFALLNWVLFTDDAGAFRILTPAKFTHVEKEIRSGAIKTTTHTFFTFPTPDSSRYFSVSYYDIDTSGIEVNDTFSIQLLQSIEEGLLASFDADKAYSAPLELRLGTGIMFRAGYNESRNAMKAQIRFYPPRVFVLQVLLPHREAMSRDAERFFHSFEYLGVR